MENSNNYKNKRKKPFLVKNKFKNKRKFERRAGHPLKDFSKFKKRPVELDNQKPQASYSGTKFDELSLSEGIMKALEKRTIFIHQLYKLM